MKQYDKALEQGAILQGSSYQYKIEKVLGQGSFGITYLASVKMTGALGTIDANVKVAIKEFFMGDINGRQGSSVEGLTEGSLPYKYKQRFKKEAENIAKLDHPNVVKVLDFIEANNTFYYVMEYIDGEDVLHYMNNNPLPEAEAVSIIKEVGRALSYMHEEKNMLHLDLKPGNIMRRKSDGHIFLIDFGLTKIYADDGKPETSTTIGQGTQGYAPLEQTNPSSKKNSFGPTIDVYALGATLLKLLTAESIPPASDVLNGDDLLEDIMAKHQVSEHLQSAIMHAMEPKPKERIATVRDFISTIEISIPLKEQDENATVYDDDKIKDVEVQSVVQGETAKVKDYSDKWVDIEKKENNCVPKKAKTAYWTKALAGIGTVVMLSLIPVVKNCSYTPNKSENYDVESLDEFSNTIAIDSTENEQEIEEHVESQVPSDAEIFDQAYKNNDWSTIEQLGNKGYTQTYYPLALHYYRISNYSVCEKWANKAIRAGVDTSNASALITEIEAEKAYKKAELYVSNEYKAYDKALYYAQKASTLSNNHSKRLRQIISICEKFNPPPYFE